MKKLFIILGICLAIAGCNKPKEALASEWSDIIDKIPAVDTGAYFSLDSKHWEFLTTFQAANYKGVNLNLGYASPDSMIISLGYDIAKLENLGIQVPVLKDIIVDTGWAIGWREITEEAEFTQGPAITFKVKF